MAELSSSSSVGEVSNAMAALDVSSPGTSSAPQTSSSVQYDKTLFWKTISIGVVEPADAKTVMAATVDLCHALLLQERRPVLIEKAALLAAQFRNFSAPSELLVDHGQLQQLFAINPDIRLDLTEGEGKRFVKGAGGWKEDFITSIEQLNEKEALLFGPPFASVVLRMGRHGVQSVALKMSKLGNKQYGETYLSLKIPSQQQLVSLLSKYVRAKPQKVLANTVYGGFMYAFHKQNLDAPTKGWLNFLALQSMFLSCMPLVSMIDNFFSGSWEPLMFKQLYLKLTARWAIHSWEAYTRLYEECAGDPFWPYSRTFSEDVFQDLTYQANHWLCNVTAFLIDNEVDPDAIQEWPTLGPSYQNLVKFKDSSMHMTLDDYESAKDIYYALKYEFRRPMSSRSLARTNDIMTEIYGPNSKWHY